MQTDISLRAKIGIELGSDELLWGKKGEGCLKCYIFYFKMTSRVCQLKQDWQVVSQTEEERRERERMWEREREREGVRVDSARSGDNTICLSIYQMTSVSFTRSTHHARPWSGVSFLTLVFFPHHQFIWTLERLRELSKSFYSRCRTCFCATEISMFYLPFLPVLCLIMAM